VKGGGIICSANVLRRGQGTEQFLGQRGKKRAARSFSIPPRGRRSEGAREEASVTQEFLGLGGRGWEGRGWTRFEGNWTILGSQTCI